MAYICSVCLKFPKLLLCKIISAIHGFINHDYGFTNFNPPDLDTLQISTIYLENFVLMKAIMKWLVPTNVSKVRSFQWNIHGTLWIKTYFIKSISLFMKPLIQIFNPQKNTFIYHSCMDSPLLPSSRVLGP